MKNLRTLLLLTMIVPFAMNCKKDDPAVAPSIVGTWQSTTFTFSLCDIPSDNGTVPCGTANPCFTTQFKSDGTFVETYPSGTYNGTYSVSGTVLTMAYSGSTTISNSFTLTSSTLTISGISTSIRPNGSAPDGVDNCTMAISFTRK